MRASFGKRWWWVSFAGVYLMQQAMLVGVTLPLHSVHAADRPWRPVLDTTAALGCISGELLGRPALFWTRRRTQAASSVRMLWA
jgi:hypothetical protein